MAFWNNKKPRPEPEVDPVDVQKEEPVISEAKKEPNRRRSVNFRLRMTEEEYAYITEQAAAANISRTDYIMAAVFGQPVIVINDVAPLLQELRKQGTNLNQAVRIANQTRSANLPQLLEAVEQCQEAQAAVKLMCDDWGMKLRKRGADNGHSDS